MIRNSRLSLGDLAALAAAPVEANGGEREAPAAGLHAERVFDV